MRAMRDGRNLPIRLVPSPSVSRSILVMLVIASDMGLHINTNLTAPHAKQGT